MGPTKKQSDEAAVILTGVQKSFRLPHERHSGIKQVFVNMYKRRRGFERQHVLKGLDFEIKKGEFFGIVGRNGSGKSTLLKLLAGIYVPDKGKVQINGSLTPFIELGVGFNPELTGRENIFLNGALLGFSHKEMEGMYDSIVEFAELGRFMDQNLKNYSSGMQVRLAFSIAVKSQSDILVFDEVLAVGDSSFQRKCFDIFERYKASSDKTVILVTHDMGSVRQFCNRAMLLSDGEILEIGDPKDIAARYDKLNQQNIDEETKKQNKQSMEQSKIKVALLDERGKRAPSFRLGSRLTVRLTWPEDLPVKNVGIAVIKESGEYIFGTNTIKGGAPKPNSNSYHYEVSLDIGPGRYHLMYGVFGKTAFEVLDFVTRGPSFVVFDESQIDWEGLLYLDHKWYN